MKVLCTKQKNAMGEPDAAWMQCRTGRITASRIVDVLNFLKPTKAEAAAGIVSEGSKRIAYRAELIAERLTLIPAEHFVSKPMRFGADYEDDARQAYELKMEVMIDQTGFVEHPSFSFAGSSPDGLTDSGGLELKVPKTETHLAYLVGDVVPEEYRPQMYFNMICCEREWWDFASFDPRLPKELQLFTKRLTWDDAEVERINGAVFAFNESIEDLISMLRDRFGDFQLPTLQIPQHREESAEERGCYLTDEELNMI